MPNAWILHIKAFAQEHGLSYACALSTPECRATYKKPVVEKRKKKSAVEQAPKEAPKEPSPIQAPIEKKKKKKKFIVVNEQPNPFLEEPPVTKQITVEEAGLKISKLIRKKRYTITANFLSNVCNDVGTCLAFGEEVDKIKYFFNNFNNFHYKKSIRKIGDGANGVVNEVHYQRLKFSAYTVIKSCKKITGDNLIYEYMVGKFFINTIYKKLPSFLETYNFSLKPKDLNKNKEFYNIKSSNKDDIKKAITVSCNDPTNILIQIEYLHNPIILRNILQSDNIFWSEDLMPTLFQIYHSLYSIKSDFTHYDLHRENILLYEPVNNKYIQYNYEFNNGTTISFKSRYIVKIIDYGRSYFNNRIDNINSTDIKNIVDNIPDCNDDKSNYFLKISEVVAKENNYILSYKNNQSHDLRLLKLISTEYGNKLLDNCYGEKRLTKINYKGEFGTPEKLTSSKVTINNISEAYKTLLKIITKPQFINDNNNNFFNLNLFGILTIYEDGRDMKFNK
jgi:hypothetical protein